MSRLANNLALLLAVQLVLVAALFWPRPDAATGEADEPLLALDTAAVDRILVSDDEKAVTLEKSGDNWSMPEYHALPVDTTKLNRVLEDLPASRQGWPVANTDSAAERFEVAEDNFQRRIQYLAGEEIIGTIYVGTSPGFRKVHTRVDGEDAIRDVEFNAYDAPASAAAWLDKTLLRVEDVTAISGQDFQLYRVDDTWQNAAGEQPDQQALDSLVNGLTSLRVTEAADIATAAIFEEMDPPPTLSVQAAGGDYEFRLFEIEDAHYVQRADIPVYFSLGSFDYERLTGATAESLFPTPGADMEDETADGDEPGEE